MPRKAIELALTDQAQRLRAARLKRGFSDAASASAFFGWNYDTYIQHERGERGLTRAAQRYAQAYRVSQAWLLTGEDPSAIPVFGRIGAGALVTLEQDVSEIQSGDYAPLPSAAACWAFVVEGDSMRPRFYPGEVVVFRRESSPEADLIGQYCLVQIKETGDRFVKILRKGYGENRWRLESHNADPMENVELLAAFSWEATLKPRDGRVVLASHAKPRSRVRRSAPPAAGTHRA
jgi:SOS-response transcriptional repressor LexA